MMIVETFPPSLPLTDSRNMIDDILTYEGL